MGRIDCRSLLLPVLLLAPGLARAQTAAPTAPADVHQQLKDIKAQLQTLAPAAPAEVQQQEEIKAQLQALARSRKDLAATQQTLQNQITDFDARIAALEAK